jgi:hypothetical protein
MTKILATLGAVAAIATALPAFAEPLPVETVTVAIADLDLATAAGQRTLDARINRDLAGRNAVRACRNAKIAEAKGQSEQRLAARSTSAIELAAY